jgi:hypothetical protein
MLVGFFPFCFVIKTKRRNKEEKILFYTMFGWREDGRKRNKRKQMKTISLFGSIEIQEGKVFQWAVIFHTSQIRSK